MGHDLTTPEGVRALLESSASIPEWRLNILAIYEANNGTHPPWLTDMIFGPGSAWANAKFNVTPEQVA